MNTDPALTPAEPVQALIDQMEREARSAARRRMVDENDDDEGHGPWNYTEYGVECSCKYPVDGDEMCTRPRTPWGVRLELLGAVVETSQDVTRSSGRGDTVTDPMEDLCGALADLFEHEDSIAKETSA